MLIHSLARECIDKYCSKVKIAVIKNLIKNLIIFGGKYVPQSVRLLAGWGLETGFGKIQFEHAVSLTGLP